MKAAIVRSKPQRSRVKRSAAGVPNPVVAAGQEIINASLRETLDPGRRLAMVAEAAYFYAEHRGFEPGYELEDWLAAEDQIDAALRLSDLEAAALNQQAT